MKSNFYKQINSYLNTLKGSGDTANYTHSILFNLWRDFGRERVSKTLARKFELQKQKHILKEQKRCSEWVENFLAS